MRFRHLIVESEHKSSLKDRNLSSRDYSWLGTSFFLGYLFFEPIGGWLFHHIKTSRFVSLTVLIWGGLV